MCCGASSSRTSRTTRSTCANSDLKRYGMITGLRAEKLEEYKRLHATVWPDVLRRIKQSHIQNYSIYLRQLRSETLWNDNRPTRREAGRIQAAARHRMAGCAAAHQAVAHPELLDLPAPTQI